MVRTQREIEALEAKLAAKREQLRANVVKAHGSGESVSELARSLGVTRTRIYQLLGR